MTKINAGVFSISDKGAQVPAVDSTGDHLARALQSHGITVVCFEVIPNDMGTIARTLVYWTDGGTLDLIFTTGGTGLSPQDITPEATRSILEKEIPGIVETMRADGYLRSPSAILNRAVAGTRGRCLIINLPENPGAAHEYFDLLMPIIPHAIESLQGR
jgi:molybdopterin adenylyltransferase